MTAAYVLGGGVAGLAAAFGLLDRGYRVELLEARSWLGGRAFSFRDRETGHLLDNGPHVMLGCYEQMRGLLRRIGTEKTFEVGSSLTMTYRLPGGHLSRLRLRSLPTSLALPLAVWSLPLKLGERMRAVLGFLYLLRGAPPRWRLAEWIARRHQRGGPERFFWRPLSRAIMNAEPEEVGADLFVKTLLQAFRGSAERAAMWFPRRPWLETIGDPACQQLIAEGAKVTRGARVSALEVQRDRVVRIGLADGGYRAVGDGSPVVSALPWYALGRLMPGRPSSGPDLEGSPLVSVYFEQEGPEGPDPDESLVYLVDGEPFHYLYRTPGHSTQRFALMAGGCTSLAGMTVREIEGIARGQLESYYPDWDPETPARVRVSKESRATFLARPQVPRPLPGSDGGLPCNLFACGDWTDTGLPSTLEGAVRSAHLALSGVQTTGQKTPSSVEP